MENVAQSYAVYDWTRPPTGNIGKALFMKATKRAGFVFTTSEIRMLSGEFAVNGSDNDNDHDSGKVAYKKV